MAKNQTDYLAEIIGGLVLQFADAKADAAALREENAALKRRISDLEAARSEAKNMAAD